MEMFEELDPEEVQEMLIMKFDTLQKVESQKNLYELDEISNKDK